MLWLFSGLVHQLRTLVYLMRHAAVPSWLKLVPVLAVVYAVLPQDLLRDRLPVLGWLDDLWVILIAFTIFTILGEWYVSKAQRPDDKKTITTSYEVVDPPDEKEPGDTPPRPSSTRRGR